MRESTQPIPADRDPFRKAAIVVASLDRESADALLDRLPAADAQKLRRAVVALREVSPSEEEAALSQFMRVDRPPNAPTSGIELDGPLAHALAYGDAQRNRVASEATMPDPPFRFLHEAPCDDLAELLSGEHAQTVAVVLAHLPAERGAELTAALPAALRVDALRRLATLEQTDESALRELEQAVQTWLKRRPGGGRRAAGVAAVAAILRAAEPSLQKEVLAAIGRRDRSLAERLSSSPMSPPVTASPTPAATEPSQPRSEEATAGAPAADELLESLDGPSLASALGALSVEAAALALAGSSPEWTARVLANLPSPRADALRLRMADLGPVSLRDIDAARRDLANAAARAAAGSGPNTHVRRAVA